jgi:hypothetical protein
MSTVEKVTFRVSGEHITGVARDLVCEGDWESAFRMLTDDIVGLGLENVYAILRGQKKLVGCNDIELVDDEPTAEYLEQIDFLYGGVVRRGDEYWKPYAVVLGYSSEDMKLDVLSLNRYNSVDSDAVPTMLGNQVRYLSWCMARNTFYMSDRANDKAVNCVYKGVNRSVLWKRIRSVPVWISTHTYWQSAVDVVGDLKELSGRSEQSVVVDSEPEVSVVDEFTDSVRTNFDRAVAKFVEGFDTKTHTLDCQNGWLSPKGVLFACEYATHERLACAILERYHNHVEPSSTPGDILLKLGYHKLQNRFWATLYMRHNRVTQKQSDTIFDYLMHHNIEDGSSDWVDMSELTVV